MWIWCAARERRGEKREKKEQPKRVQVVRLTAETVTFKHDSWPNIFNSKTIRR